MQTTDEQNNELLLTPAAEATTSQPIKKKRERSSTPRIAPEEKHQIVNFKKLSKKKFTGVKLNNYYGEMFGEIEGKTRFFIYGPPGHGKSVFELKLLGHLTEVFGKGLLDSHEERLNKSLKKRAENFLTEEERERIFFGDALPFDELVRRTQDRKYRVIARDSIQYCRHTQDNLKTWNKFFPNNNTILIFTSFGMEIDKPSDAPGYIGEAMSIFHDCDVKIFVYKGYAHVKSRYLDNVTKSYWLYDYVESEIEAQSDYAKAPSQLEREIVELEQLLRDKRIVLGNMLAHTTPAELLASAQTTSHEPATAPTAS